MKGVLTGNRFLSHHTTFGQMIFWTLPGNTKPVAPLGDQGRICLWWRGTHYDLLVLSDAIWSRRSAQPLLLVGVQMDLLDLTSTDSDGFPNANLFIVYCVPGIVLARLRFRFGSGLARLGAYVGSAPTHWLHTPATGVAESSWTRWLHPRTGHGHGRVRWVFASSAFHWSHVEKT